jgi:hypothetical protein
VCGTFVDRSIERRAILRPKKRAFNRKRNPVMIIRVLSATSSLLVLLATVPALAGVTVNNPVDGAQVASPFNLSATAASCSSQSVSAMGYSFDSSSDTTVIQGGSVETSVGTAAGTHTLHVKAWGEKGSACVTDVTVNVQAGPTSVTGDSIIPSNAVAVSNIQAMGNWEMEHDDGGPGSSSGWMQSVNSPSLIGSSRQFVTQYSNGGDERYSVTYSDDTSAHNFFYDAWVYFTSSSNDIGNLEMDTNQVMPDGQTVIFGVQCDGYSGNWAYTANIGTPENPQPKWLSKGGTNCNPRAWKTYTWHHVQAYYSRDDSGWVTYHSVWLDGVESPLNETVNGAFDLGWGPMINTQFQVDGLGSSGHSTVYLDNLTVSRW